MRPEDFKDEMARAIQRITEDIWAKAKLKAYPVGSYYISENPTSPAALFGGTWAQLDDGLIISSADANLVGTTTGSATHTITTVEMPAHTHAGPSHTHTATTNSVGGHTHTATTNSSGAHTHTATTASGGAHTHNLPAVNSYMASNNLYVPAVNKDTSGDNSGYVKSGGEHTHTLTTNSAGGHTHTATTASSGAHTHTLTTAAGGTGNTGSAGGGQAFSIMQPTLFVYMWIRTA